MYFYTAIFVIGVVVVSAGADDVQPLPEREVLLNATEELRPLVDPSNNLSTDGYDVYPGQFPHFSKLYIKNIHPNAATLAGGSLITPNYILTRANALRESITMYNFTYGYAILGTDGSIAEIRQQINFQQCGVQLHPTRDLATVRLDHPVTLNKFVQPIRLPALSDIRTYELMEGTNVGSWGRKYLRNQVMANDDCHEQHPNTYIYPYNICTNTYVGGTFCQRDYGSGLIVEDDKGPILVGIAISNYMCNVNYPNVYLRVSEFRDWISMNSNYVFDF